MTSANRRRSPWRRRLVEAERGFTQGFRGDSTLVVHLFAGCLVIAAGLVLGLSVERWAILAVSFTVVLAAELFNKLARIVCRHADGGSGTVRQAASIGTAAVFVSIAGTLVVVALFLGGRVFELLETTHVGQAASLPDFRESAAEAGSFGHESPEDRLRNPR